MRRAQERREHVRKKREERKRLIELVSIVFLLMSFSLVSTCFDVFFVLQLLREKYQEALLRELCRLVDLLQSTDNDEVCEALRTLREVR